MRNERRNETNMQGNENTNTNAREEVNLSSVKSQSAYGKSAQL